MTATAGPAAPLVRDPEVAAWLPEARATISRVARTFSVASRLLPRPIREDVDLLYLVLRTLDDFVDGAAFDPALQERLAAVEGWAAGTAGASGAAPGASGPAATREVRILDELERRHPGLPREAVAHFMDGMRQDLAGPSIETEDDLDLYSYRVAGTVGRLMAAILGTRGDAAADRAARSLGIAMQRTNILRDIDEDRANGRGYLPAATLARHGIRDLAADDRTTLLRDEIARADAAYEVGIAGIPLLLHGRRSILAAALMYREILRQLERDGLGARRPHRAVVPRSRKLALLARCLV